MVVKKKKKASRPVVQSVKSQEIFKPVLKQPASWEEWAAAQTNPQLAFPILQRTQLKYQNFINDFFGQRVKAFPRLDQ